MLYFSEFSCHICSETRGQDIRGNIARTRSNRNQNEELEKYKLPAAGTTCKGGVAVKSLVRVNPGPNPSSYLGQR